MTEPEPRARGFDVSVAHPARIYHYWLGDKDNFAVDRQAAEEVLAVMPVMAQVARSVRLFLATVVHYTRSATAITLRSRPEVARFFRGLDLIAPGSTPLGQWSPGDPQTAPGHLPTYTALARKP
jgi:hypothetical protein